MNAKPGGSEAGARKQLLIRGSLILLIALAAATVGDALRINERFRNAAAAVIQTLGGGPQPSQQGPGYSAVLQRQRIEGAADPQGLSYNPSTRTLLTVLGHEQAIAELDRCGVILRRITVPSTDSLEEATAISDQHVLLSFADTSTIALVSLEAGQSSIDPASGVQIELIEGGTAIDVEEIAWDGDGKRLFLASKEYPPQIYSASFDLQAVQASKGRTHRLKAHTWLRPDRILPFMPDISSLAYSPARGELLLLSDETRDIVAVTGDRSVKPFLRLQRGAAGLSEPIRSPEGMAIASDASIYLISDPDAVYLYRLFPEEGLSRQSTCNAP
ncbi:MAG: SdiA-regulated domain-containing protein [Cyanobium sp. Prado107]|jgi:uncharacterized protein YjiK|nr:SdiA-regulated domain-containing protein [Cyanobium sp. Prado107]